MQLFQHLDVPFQVQLADTVIGERESARSRIALQIQIGALYGDVNAGKLGLSLDLSLDAARKVVLDLARWGDVLIESFAPGVMKRWGLDYETIQERNPGVVYCSITGFGQDGPYRDLPGYDTLGVGMGGLLSLLTDMKNPVPSFTLCGHA